MLKQVPPECVEAQCPGVIPDNRVSGGDCRYADRSPIADLVAGATHLRGIISGLDPDGFAWLHHLLGSSSVERCCLILAVYGGSRTWDDVLRAADSLQQLSKPDRVEFRISARRIGADRPANLLWIQKGGADAGIVVTGNVSNFLVRDTWDPTDAVLALPLASAGADALRRWFDHAYAHSRPLNDATAMAPRLRLPEGTPEGERQWAEYLDVLDGANTGTEVPVTINAQTGEVETAPEPTPTQKQTFPRPDLVFQTVQEALAKGALVAIDRTDRPPPLDMPVSPEFFGESQEKRTGSVERKQSFKVSLFDKKTAQTLETRRNDLATRLAAFSVMLREGERWMPDAAFKLFEQEAAAVDAKARQALTDATGGKKAEEFVATRMDQIVADCERLAAELAPGRKLSPELTEKVRASLVERLTANLENGMGARLSRTQIQLAAADDERQSPWGAVQTFLAATARLPRKVLTDPYRMRGLVAKSEELIRAFDLFGDPLVAAYLDGRRVEEAAGEDLALIERIVDEPNASPRQRAHALYRLLRGEEWQEIEAALTEDLTST